MKKIYNTPTVEVVEAVNVVSTSGQENGVETEQIPLTSSVMLDDVFEV